MSVKAAAKDWDLVIEPGRTEKNYWKDLWRFRELFYILSWRDIKVRYKQTVLGVAWSVIRPILTTLIFTFIFDKLVTCIIEPDIFFIYYLQTFFLSS